MITYNNNTIDYDTIPYSDNTIVTITLFISHSTLLFHSTTLLYHFTDFSLTSFSPCCLLMLLLSLTHPDSLSHEPSFLVGVGPAA
jgi:hypothetical protein